MATLIRLLELIKKDKLQKSEAIIWLQGDRFDRGLKVAKLYKQGWAKKIILTGNDTLVGQGKRQGENNVRLQEMKKWLINKKVKSKDIIIESNSFNTKDQAKNILIMAKKNNWPSFILVGSWPYYQFRAFLTFLKASKKNGWQGRIINQYVEVNANKRPGGRNKITNVLMKEEIIKLKKYKKDLATINEGVRYLTAKL